MGDFIKSGAVLNAKRVNEWGLGSRIWFKFINFQSSKELFDLKYNFRYFKLCMYDAFVYILGTTVVATVNLELS